MATKSKAEIATIDVALVTIATGDGKEIGFDTSDQVSVTIQTETTDAVKLVVKGILRAQKPKSVTVTGNEITLTDNVFNPELIEILMGGTCEWNDDDGTLKKYTPPLAGEKTEITPFTLNIYSAHYDASGLIVNYEKTSYPNCQGEPLAFSSQDDTFRVNEYTITSAPKDGEPPYTIEYVDELPDLEDSDDGGTDGDDGGNED